MTTLNRFAATVGLLFAMLTAHSFAAESSQFHRWQADSQTRGGKTVSCNLQLVASTENMLITSTLALFAEHSAPENTHMFTALKISASKYDSARKEVPIELAGGWIRSSSGSTIGRLTTVKTDAGTEFLGAASGPELFQNLLDGIIKDGMSVGYQEKAASFDNVLRIAEPLPPERLRNLQECLDDLGQRL
jgi:hypothetical protein